MKHVVGPNGTVDGILASCLAAPGSILSTSASGFTDSALLRERTVHSTIFDRTHLVLVRDKLVLQKRGSLNHEEGNYLML